MINIDNNIPVATPLKWPWREDPSRLILSIPSTSTHVLDANMTLLILDRVIFDVKILPEGYISSTVGQKTKSTFSFLNRSKSLSSFLGYVLRSSLGPNCVGLTTDSSQLPVQTLYISPHIEAPTTSVDLFAALTSDKWPSWRYPCGPSLDSFQTTPILDLPWSGRTPSSFHDSKTLLYISWILSDFVTLSCCLVVLQVNLTLDRKK